MIVNGIDVSGLTHSARPLDFPDEVKGRVVSIDADFLAYMASFQREDDPKSWEDMKHNCEELVNTIKSLAGAEKIHCHLTPASSNKGYRNAIAQLKEYQANRDGKSKPEYLHVMREWIAQRWPSTQHQNCEADDGMSEMQYRAIAEGNKHLHIIATKDKDLDMVPGLHVDWDTGVITDHDEFGEIWIDSSGSAKKLKGMGQKFFWAQLLMGDSADNISGLPALSVSARDRTDQLPSSLLTLRTKMEASSDGLLKIKYDAQLKQQKEKKIGPVCAYELLTDIRSNKEAFQFVLSLFRDYGTFYNYRNNQEITYQQAFLSEAALLWMRKNKADPADVKKWFQEIGR